MSYEGTLSWCNGDRATVRNAIVERDRIAFDAQSPAGTYNVVLRQHPESDQWVGDWTSGGRKNKLNARVKRSGNVVDLSGLWLDGENYRWDLELSPQ